MHLAHSSCNLEGSYLQAHCGHNFQILPKYRVSHQYGNTFNFDFLILYQCYCKSKTSSEKLRFKPSRGHLDFDFFQKIRLFFRVGKKRNKTEFFFGSIPPPPPFFQNVPRFCFLRFMYPGTWTFVSSSNPCTRVHGILFFLQIHVPGYMNLRKQNLGTF